jgi:alpha-glucosidase
MKIRSPLLCGCVMGLGAMHAHAVGNTLKLKSPDGQIEVVLSVDAGHVSWQASMDGHAMLEKEPLEIHADGHETAGAIHFGQAQRYRIDDRYPWYGVHSVAEEHGSGLRVPLLGLGAATAFTLEARAYNNGVAFRMTLAGSEPCVPQETVGFQPVAGSEVWSFDPSVAHYEGVYEESRAAEIPRGRFMAPPVVIELPGDLAYLAITEGRLVNYPGMVLQSDGKGAFFTRPGNEVPPDKALIYFQGKETAKRLAIPAKISGPIVTPWRIVMIARNLNNLVNNDIVGDVSDPPDPRIFLRGIRTPWIKPGRALWNFLDGGGTTLEGSEKMSQMAGELGFEYQEVEGYWRDWSEAQIKELADYSRTQGVGIWLWTNRRSIATEEQRQAFFDLCNRTGVVGVKVDFFDSEAKEVVAFYQTLLQETAAHHLLVNFHGSNKPTGEQRTWPNELTREAVEGMEYCCTNTGGPDAPRAQHAATLPFTRLLTGPADYTPMIFDKGLNGTTWANQIASAAIITSPLLTFAANPDTILSNPAAGMIKSIPSTWDETIVLPPSAIGQVVAFARRKGNTWFVAVDNGTASKKMRISLSFLGKGEYQVRSVGDVKDNPAAVDIQNLKVNRSGFLNLDLQSGGGFIASFVPRHSKP